MDEQNRQLQILQIQDDSSEDSIDLKAYISSLARRWWVIAIIFILSLSMAFLYIRNTKKIYEATATVKIPSSSGSGGGLASLLGGLLPVGFSSDLATEIEAIKGKDIAEKAIKNLQYDKKPEYANLNYARILAGFQSRIKVIKKGQTTLVDIKAIGSSPLEAKDMANFVAEEYQKKSKEATQDSWQNLINLMGAKLDESKNELEKSRQLLHEYEAKEGISTAFSPLLLGGGVTGQAGSQYMIPDVPQAVAALKSSIIQMEIKLESLRKRLPEANPEIIDLTTQINQTKQSLKEEENKAIAKYNKQFGLTALAAKVLFNQQMLTQVVTKHEELKAQYIMQFKSVEIIENAVEPMYPSKPRPAMIAMLGAVMGMFLGLCFAIMLEYLDDTIRTPDSLGKKIDFPIIGKIPKMKGKTRTNGCPSLLIYGEHNKIDKKSWLTRFYKESYTALRTEALSSLIAKKSLSESEKGKAILITSPEMKEGKSLVSLNLAISLAQTNLKTLIIDIDPRHSLLKLLSEINPGAGLIDYLTEKDSWDNIINPTQITKLSIVVSQTRDSEYDLSGLLLSDRMSTFMQKARENFDFIIFDSTPITLSSESISIGSMVDSIILVVRSSYTKGASLSKALQIIKNSNIGMLGIVITCSKPEKRYRKYYKQLKD
jgi:capsular exopolysaccharide synthesis family protein